MLTGRTYLVLLVGITVADRLLSVKTIVMDGDGLQFNLGQDVVPGASGQTCTVTQYKRGYNAAPNGTAARIAEAAANDRRAMDPSSRLANFRTENHESRAVGTSQRGL